MVKIGILDYGVGNLFSLKCALQREGSTSTIISKLSCNLDINGLILPGVGSFGSALKIVNRLKTKISNLVDNNIPILGICLGMQLFYEKSDEADGKGLSIFKGNVVRLPNTVKVPHIGWNNIWIIEDCKILEGIKNGSWMYYVHSYYTKSKYAVKAKTEYGKIFPSVIEKDNIFGTQFHPEKSGKIGSRIIKNFVNLCSK